MATLKRGIASNIRPSGHLMVPDPCLMLQDRNCARQHCWLGSAFGRDLSLVHLVLYPIAVELPAIGPHISACRYRLICRWIGSSFCSKTGRQGIRPLPSPCMSLLMKFPWAGLRTMNSNSKSDNSFVSHPFCRFGASYMQPSPHMNLPWPCFLAKGLASDTFRWILMETTKDTDFFLLRSYHPWKSRWRLIHLPTARCPDHPCRSWYARMCQSIVRVIIEMLRYKMTTLAKISSQIITA